MFSSKFGTKARMLVCAVAISMPLTALVAQPASAASTVRVHGTARCKSGVSSTLAAMKVTIRLDSGGQLSSGTGYFGDYSVSFGSMPSGGTWASAFVDCPPGSYNTGYQSRRFIKPGTWNDILWNLSNA